jgi:sugar phosphate permease
MQRVGWQWAILYSAVPMLALVLLWARVARDAPDPPPAAAAAEPTSERGRLDPGAKPRVGGVRVLLERQVLLLTCAYLSTNYVYYLLSNWSFLYLVQQRHLGVAQSGWLAALPPLGAALGAGLGGALADALAGRFGVRWGYRLVPLVSLPMVAVLLLVAVFLANAHWAVALLTLCYALLELNEGPFWAATMRIAGSRTMTATGLLNTGGAAGGLIGIPVVAWLSGHGAWTVAFGLGSVTALLGALGWLWVDAGPKE